MLHATTLTIGFNETEDRIVAICRDNNGGNMIILLTRRLVQRLLPALTSLLEHSSVTASKAPLDMRAEVILMEHQAALSSIPTPDDDASKAAQDAPKTLLQSCSNVDQVSTLALVSKIDVTTHQAHFTLIFQDVDMPRLSMNFDRSDLHRFVDMLLRMATIAEWEIKVQSGWVAQNTSRLSIS